MSAIDVFEGGTDVEVGGFDPLGFVEDLGTSALDALKKGVNFITGVLQGLPGAGWIVDAANQGAEWAHGLAATSVGQDILKTLATGLQSSVAWYVGPAVGNALWALHRDTPNILDGDPLTSSWISQFARRTEEVAKSVGTANVSTIFTSPMQRTIAEVVERARRQYPNDPIREAVKHVDVAQIANDIGVRQDIVALAIALLSKSSGSINLSNYNLGTGVDITIEKAARAKAMARFKAAHPQFYPRGASVPVFPDTAAGDVGWYRYHSLLHAGSPSTLQALAVQYENRGAKRRAAAWVEAQRITAKPSASRARAASKMIHGLGIAAKRVSPREPSPMSKVPSRLRFLGETDVEAGGFDPLGFAEDLATSALDRAKAIAKPFVNTLKELPGGKDIVALVEQGKGWAVDLATKNPWVLQALATMLYGPLAHALGGTAWFGPQIATVVWALPGVVRGESFMKAWLSEVLRRSEKTAEYFGGEKAKELVAQLRPAINELLSMAKQQFPTMNPEQALQALNISPADLAQKLGIREDMAALAIEYAKNRIGLFNVQAEYDPSNGASYRKAAKKRAAQKLLAQGPYKGPRTGPTFPDTAAGDLAWYQYNKKLHAGAPATLNALAVQYRNRGAARSAKAAAAAEVQTSRPSSRMAMLTQVTRPAATQVTRPAATQRAGTPVQAAAPRAAPMSFASYSPTPDVAAAADPALFSAKATLIQAIQELGGVSPTDQAVYWLLGLVYGESRFGTSPDWTMPNENNPNPPFQGPSHNWGAVRYFKNDALIIRHPDKGGVFNFQAYTSPLEGAKGFFRTIVRGKVGSVITDPSANPRMLAEAMYINGYYEGSYCSNEGKPSIRLNGKSPVGCSSKTNTKYVMATQSEADQRNIGDYAAMIYHEADKVRKVFSEGPGPAPSPAPSPPTPSSTSKPFPYLIAGVIVVGAAGTYMLTRKRGGILRFA